MSGLAPGPTSPPTVTSPRWNRRRSCVRSVLQAQRRAWPPPRRAFRSRTSPSTPRWLLPPFITGRTRSRACARCGAWLAACRPSLTELARAIGARVAPVPIPWDCADGFFEAYWRRPEAYLNDNVRRGISVWASVGPDAEQRAVRSLRDDLASGRWAERNRDLLDLEAAELGLRLLIA